MSFLDALPDYGQQAQAQPVAQSGASFLDQLPDYSGKSAEATIEPGSQQPKTGTLQRIGIDFNNQQQAAAQRTTPIVSSQQQNLLGPAIENDSGEIGYKGPNGEFSPTDSSKHVVLTDPEDNTPKVYARSSNTNEGALSSLGRLIGSAMGAGNIEVTKAAPAAVQAADRLGVSLPKGIASDSPIVKFAGQVVAKAPGGGPLTEAIPQSIQQLEGKVGEAANLAGGAASPQAAGEGFSGAVENYFKPAAKAATANAYDNLNKLVDQNKLTPLSNTQSTIADITARRLASGEDSAGKAVETVLGGASRPGGLTFEGIKDLRTRVGEMLDTGMFPEGMSQGELRGIYGSLSKDLQASAQNAGGDRAVAALAKANDMHAQASEWKDSLAKVLGNNRSGEGVYQSIVRMASNGPSADQKTLMAARAAVPSEVWSDVASTAISTLGKTRNGEWSPAAFLSDYRNLSDGGKRVLFGSSGSAKVIPFLDDIADVSKKFVSAGKLANTSGTAGHNVAYTLLGSAATGLAHGSFIEPVTAASAVFGINVMARILATPATAASMARWSNVYSRIARNPGPAGIAAFNRASGEFASTVNGALGTRVDPNNFIRAIQAPVKSSAQGNEQEIPGHPGQ